MELDTLTLEKFASFRQKRVFTFPSGPGLYFMTGENEVDTRLEANGTGKTTVWNALTWLFFEKDLKGRRASDICTWGVKGGTSVSAKYKDTSGALYTLVRTWNPNSFQLVTPDGEAVDLTKDETNLLYHHLKLSYSMFMNSVIFGQKEPMFLDMSATEKSTLFSSVMDLDHWITLSDKAAARVDILKEDSAKINNELSAIHSKIETLQDVDYSEESEVWNQNHAIKLKENAEEIDTLRKEIRGKTQEAGAEKRNLEALLLEESKLKTKVADAERESNTLHDEKDSISNSISKKEGEVAAVQRRSNSLDRLGTSCPYCLQSIDEKHKHRIHSEVDREVDAINKRSGGLSEKLSQVQDLVVESDKILHDLQEKLSTTKYLIREASIKEQQATSRLNQVKTRLQKLEEERTALEEELNPYIALWNRNNLEIEACETTRSALQKKLEDTMYLFQSNTYWIKGFKEIRLFLISETLQQLEIETNSSLTQLGLPDWKILFDVDRETKGGKFQKGFNVLIKSPTNKDAVAWESWSGGESQRLRLAAAMGLSNLIKSRTGATISLEVWDEPTTSMSQQGVSDFLDKLKERSVTENLQIWIIDHNTLGYNQFDGIVKVVKDNNGSCFHKII